MPGCHYFTNWNILSREWINIVSKTKSGVAGINLLLSMDRRGVVVLGGAPLTRVTRVGPGLWVAWLEDWLLTRDRRHVAAPQTDSPRAGPAGDDGVTLQHQSYIETLRTRGHEDTCLQGLPEPGLEPGHHGVHLAGQGERGGDQEVEQVAGVGHAEGLLLSLETRYSMKRLDIITTHLIRQGFISELPDWESKVAFDSPDYLGEEGLGWEDVILAGEGLGAGALHHLVTDPVHIKTFIIKSYTWLFWCTWVVPSEFQPVSYLPPLLAIMCEVNSKIKVGENKHKSNPQKYIQGYPGKKNQKSKF